MPNQSENQARLPHSEFIAWASVPLGLAADYYQYFAPFALIAFGLTLAAWLLLGLKNAPFSWRQTRHAFFVATIIFGVIFGLQVLLRGKGGWERGAISGASELQAELLLTDAERRELEFDRSLASLSPSEQSTAVRERLAISDRPQRLATLQRILRAQSSSLNYLAHEELVALLRTPTTLSLNPGQEPRCGRIADELFGAYVQVDKVELSEGTFTGRLITRKSNLPFSGRITAQNVEIAARYNPLDGSGEQRLNIVLAATSTAQFEGTASPTWSFSCKAKLDVV